MGGGLLQLVAYGGSRCLFDRKSSNYLFQSSLHTLDTLTLL